MDTKPEMNPEPQADEVSSSSNSKGQTSDNVATLNAIPETDESSEEIIHKLSTDLEKAKNEYLYLLAEFENFKRNMIKERSDLRKYGSERLMVDLLNVIDIFETALQTPANAENIDSFRKGMEMTAVEFKSVLQRHGAEEIPALGQAFDPKLHEAISSEVSNEVPEGHITRVFKKPFKLYDRVIRPGQVVVAKK